MLEPNAKIKSGLFAFALGVSATVAGAGGFFALENSAFAQNYQPNHTRTLADGLSNPAGVNAPLPSDSQVGVPENIKTQKNQLLLTARQALAYGDMNTAERKVSELAQMNLTYTKSEDQPTYVLELVNQHKNALQSLQSEGATETNRRIYADVLTREALALMLYNDLDNAEMLAQRAFEQGLMYSAEAIGKGHDPQSILKRIQDKRIAARGTNRAPIQGSGNSPVSGMVQKQIIESGKILAQARMALQNGRIEQAEQFLRQAVAYGIPDSHYPQGADTPGQLRVDLSRARVSQSEYAQVNHEFISPASNRNGAPGGSTVHALYNSGNDTSRIRQVGSSDYNEFDFPVIQGEAEPLPAYGSQMQSGGILAEADRVSTNLTEQIRAEMARDISVAYRIRNDNPQEALNVLFNARAKIENSDLDPLQKQMCLRQIDFSVDATQRYMDTNRPRIEMVEVNRKVLEEIQANREDKAFLEQKLKELCEQVNACLDDGRHEDAMYLANKAYELAPDDPTAKLLYTTTRMQHEALYYDQTKRLKEEGFYNAMMAVDRAAIPYGFEKGPLVIDDLETRTRALGRQGIDESIRSLRSERELEIIRKIETPIRLDFEDLVPLEAVISHIQGYTGIVIVPDPNALQELDITMDQMVRAQLPTEIKLRSALNLLLKPMGLTYIVEDEVLKITTPSRAKGRMRVERYYIGDLVVPVQSLTASSTHSLEASHERAMHRTYGRNQGGPGNVRGASFTGAQNANGILDQSVLASLNPQINPGGMIAPNNLDYLNQYGQRGGASVDASSIIGLIESVTGEDGAWDDAPPPTFYQNTLSLVIRQTEEVHTEIADLLKQLRKLNDLQVTVEVRFITLSDNFFERMGVDFQANFRNNGASNKAWFESGTSDSGNSNNNNNNSSSNNSNSSSNNSNSNSNSNNNNNNSSSSSSGTSVHGNDVTVGLSAPGIFTANFDVPLTMGHYAAATPVFGGFSPDAGASLGFAILSDIEAFFFMNAAQGDTRSNVLQAPKITLFNGLPGTIEDTTQTPFVTGVRPVVGDFAAAYEPIITILTEGSTLHVQAVVDNDRQHVRVTLNPVFSQITNKTNTFRYDGETAVETDETSRTRGDAENPANSDEYDTGVKTVARQSGVTIQQPVVASVMVSTTVSVPDGGTILLGGVKRLSEGRTEQGVPIVNKIPFLNRLFMNTAIGRETSSLMFMVTPRILIQEEEELFINGSTSTNF